MSRYSDYADYLRQPMYRLIRAAVLRRADGKCEECGEPAALEVHHLQYPAWGSYDTPSNLRAVCHDCHSRTHGKSNGGGTTT